MKIGDLKNGMVLKRRNGTLSLYLNGISYSKSWYTTINSVLNDDLLQKNGNNLFDIIEIYSIKHHGDILDILNENNLELIWKR